MRAVVDSSSDRAVFRQIADTLRVGIADGSLVPGARLPSENELMTTYGTARETVRRAIGLLKGEGLVETQHGRGAFVRTAPEPTRVHGDRTQEGTAETLSVKRVKSNAAVAGSLGIRAGTTVVRRERRHVVDHHPVELSVSYIPWRIAADTPLVAENPGSGGVYARLQESGYRLSQFTEDVTARMPTPDEARALHLTDGMPVLTIARVAFDTDDTPIEVVNSVMAANRFVLTYDLPVR